MALTFNYCMYRTCTYSFCYLVAMEILYEGQSSI